MKHLDNRPMMSDEEIEIIDDLLLAYKPKLCLEWGSGGSTVYFPTYGFIELWIAIEHDGNVLDLLYDKFPGNVQTIWILEGDSYADCVQRTHQRFDFILIDGLDREKCLKNALEIVSPEGIILLHDSGRAEYQEFIERYKGVKLIDGEEPYEGHFKHRGLHLFRSPYGTS